MVMTPPSFDHFFSARSAEGYIDPMVEVGSWWMRALPPQIHLQRIGRRENDHRLPKATITLRPDSLLSALGYMFITAVAISNKCYVCAECRDVFESARKPTRGAPHYCSMCRAKGVPARNLKRIQRSAPQSIVRSESEPQQRVPRSKDPPLETISLGPVPKNLVVTTKSTRKSDPKNG